MPQAQSFEELIAWQKARALTRQIYNLTNQSNFSRDYGLKDQIRRASVSVMSNIAEGYERYNSAEFRHFLNIARASCGEVRSQLYVALDAGYITDAEFEKVKSLAVETSRIIHGLRKSQMPAN